VTSSNYVTFTK